MRKNTLNFIVDLLTMLAIFAMVGTGLIIYYTLPAGSVKQGLTLWGLDRHAWGEVHFWAAVVLAALLVLHVALHWAWVCGTTRRLMLGPKRAAGRGKSTLDNLWGAGFLVVVIGLFAGLVLVANASVDGTAGEQSGGSQQRRLAGGAQDAAGALEQGPAEHVMGRGGGQGDNGGGQQRRGQEFGPEGHSRYAGGVEISGSMTLAEVGAATGVSPALILTAMGLPDDVPTDVQLRILKDRYDFEMHDLRAAIAEHM